MQCGNQDSDSDSRGIGVATLLRSPTYPSTVAVAVLVATLHTDLSACRRCFTIPACRTYRHSLSVPSPSSPVVPSLAPCISRGSYRTCRRCLTCGTPLLSPIALSLLIQASHTLVISSQHYLIFLVDHSLSHLSKSPIAL